MLGVATMKWSIAAAPTSHSRFEPIEQGMPCSAARAAMRCALAMPALLAGIEAEDVAALLGDQLAGLDLVEAAFVRQDLLAGPCAELPQARVVAPRQRLLDQRQPALGELVQAREGCGFVPAAIGVDRQGDVRADRGADGLDAGDVLDRVGPDLDLDRVEPRRHQRGRHAPSHVGLVGPQREPVPHGQRAAGPAQQLVDRLPGGAAGNVPAGHLEGRLGEPVVDRDGVEPAVDLVDLPRDRSRSAQGRRHVR